MPVMTGIGAIKEIRRREQENATRRLPIILVTSDIDPEQLAKTAGADMSIRKPVDFVDLALALSKFNQ